MSDQQPEKPRSISEISHLFLSSVRDNQTGSTQRPVRIGPNARKAAEAQAHAPQPAAGSVDLTPEEYAQVMGTPEPSAEDSDTVRIPPITALIAQHLNGRAPQRVRDYARHLAANGERVGLLEVDGGEIRLSCFERSIEPNAGDPDPAATTEHFDGRVFAESLDEMSWDLDRWLLALPNLRSPEARALLKEVDHWTLLSTCDHDGVVSCYRSLKGLANLHHPRLTLALMETQSETQAAKIFRKLSSVCLQFLGIELEGEPTVRPTRAVAEHVVAHCRPSRDKAQLAQAAQWQVVQHFLARSKAQEKVEPQTANIETPLAQDEPELPEPIQAAPIAMPAAPAPVLPPPALAMRPIEATDPISEVLELSGDIEDPQALLSTVLQSAGAEMIECPIRPPMCPQARLVLARDKGLILIAAASKGLPELKNITKAFAWLTENRALLQMAMPQLAMDTHRQPKLRLLLDQSDSSAQSLAPLLESSTVSLQSYRKLRWGSKLGLLLEAA